MFKSFKLITTEIILVNADCNITPPILFSFDAKSTVGPDPNDLPHNIIFSVLYPNTNLT